MTNYLHWLRQRSSDWLDAELFEPQWSGATATCRLCIGFACVLFFSSWYGSIEPWIGENGPLNADLSRFLIGENIESSGANFRISPFFVYDQSVFVIGYLFVATVLSLIMISGFGGRIVPFAVWIMMLALLHRVSVLQSLGEILLSSAVAYLIIDNGWITEPTRVGFADNKQRWTTALAIGLMRWHLILWIFASLCSHLSQTMWWDGTAIWNISVYGQNAFLSPNVLAKYEWLFVMAASGWILLHLVFLITLLFDSLRPLAVVIGTIFWISAYILTNDWMYSVAGFAMLSCVFYNSSLRLKRLPLQLSVK